MPSLLDAIEAKYGSDESDCEAPIGIYVPRYGPRKSIPRLLVLNDCGVDTAGDEESLKKTCSGIIEIDLAHNRLTEWSEISKILHYAPSTSFLNLSFNTLNSSSLHLSSTDGSSSSTLRRFPLLPRLSVLILIGTKVPWDDVWFLLRHAGNLQELHLSLNDYTTVDTSKLNKFPADRSVRRSDSGGEDSGNGSSSSSSSGDDEEDSGCFHYLRRLMFDGNPVTCWEEVRKLGVIFPSIRHLGLADCPLGSIPETVHQNFQNLVSLTLSNTQVGDLSDIGRLGKWASLTDLRLQGIPLFTDMTAHERRQLLVALMPNVKRLNGGAPVSTVEREDAERAFIRRYVDGDKTGKEKPVRFYELVSVHGELQPLLDLSLKPTTRVKVGVLYADNICEKHLNVYQTTAELKASLEQLVGFSAGKMRLFFVDSVMQQVIGREEMRFPQKQLYSYNMHDGDEIHVEQKKCPVPILPPSSSPSGGGRACPRGSPGNKNNKLSSSV